jgi:hypothetical protein
MCLSWRVGYWDNSERSTNILDSKKNAILHIVVKRDSDSDSDSCSTSPVNANCALSVAVGGGGVDGVGVAGVVGGVGDGGQFDSCVHYSP